jgi:hypothetical protein
MEGRAAGQFRTLDEDDVVPAESREPVEDGAAADAATDNHCPRSIPHSRTLDWNP